ncbi:hypothetical protein CLOM_g19166 [Closterium sp. NIES-68]|nr:hypothetical protein CLOM_g19166 [Closterium sp. NIES-68]
MASDRGWGGPNQRAWEVVWGRGEGEGAGEAESEGVWERVVYMADDRGALERLMKRKGGAGGRCAAGQQRLIGEAQVAVAALGESAEARGVALGMTARWQGLAAPDVAGKGGGETWQRAKWGLQWFDSPTADDWEDGFPEDGFTAHEAGEAAQGAGPVVEGGQGEGGEGEGEGEYSRRVAEGLLEQLAAMPSLLHPPPLLPAGPPVPAIAEPASSTHPPVPPCLPTAAHLPSLPAAPASAPPPPAAPAALAAPAAPAAPAAVSAPARAAIAPSAPTCTTTAKSAPSLASLLPPVLDPPPPPLPRAASSPPVEASQAERQPLSKSSPGPAVRPAAAVASHSSQAEPVGAPMLLQQQLSQLQASQQQQQQGHAIWQHEQRYQVEQQIGAAQQPCHAPQHPAHQQQQQHGQRDFGVFDSLATAMDRLGGGGETRDRQPTPLATPPARTSLASLLPPLPSGSSAPPTPRTPAGASAWGRGRGPTANASLPFKSRLAQFEAKHRQQQQQQQGMQAGSTHEAAPGAQSLQHAWTAPGEAQAPWDGGQALHVTVTSVSLEGHVAVCMCQQHRQHDSSAAPMSQPPYQPGTSSALGGERDGGGDRGSHLGAAAPDDARDAGGAVSATAAAADPAGAWRGRCSGWDTRDGDARDGDARDGVAPRAENRQSHAMKPRDATSPQQQPRPFLAIIPTTIATTLNTMPTFVAAATAAGAAASASHAAAIQPGTAITLHPPWYHLPLVLPPPWGHTHAVFATHATPLCCTQPEAGAAVAAGRGAAADKGLPVEAGGGMAPAWGNKGS